MFGYSETATKEKKSIFLFENVLIEQNILFLHYEYYVYYEVNNEEIKEKEEGHDRYLCKDDFGDCTKNNIVIIRRTSYECKVILPSSLMKKNEKVYSLKLDSSLCNISSSSSNQNVRKDSKKT